MAFRIAEEGQVHAGCRDGFVALLAVEGKEP